MYVYDNRRKRKVNETDETGYLSEPYDLGWLTKTAGAQKESDWLHFYHLWMLHSFSNIDFKTTLTITAAVLSNCIVGVLTGSDPDVQWSLLIRLSVDILTSSHHIEESLFIRRLSS